MKDSLKPILIVVMLLMMTCDSEAAKPQGLFQRLIKIKYNSELYLVIKTKEANKLNKPEMADSALAVYNTIRWTMDGLVYQLSGDMVAANSPKKFKQMNNWALSNTAAVASAAAATLPYTQTLQDLESLSQTYLPAISLISEMEK